MYTQISINDMPSSGWYEENRIAYIIISDNAYIYRQETVNGSIQYLITVDNNTTMIPKSFFESLLNNYHLYYIIEYKFLDENYKTYSIFKSANRAYKKEDI